MSNKLHELLAVEQDRKQKGNQALGEAKNTFTKKAPYFDGMVKRYISLEDDAEMIPDEKKGIITTVKQKLEDAIETVIRGIDAHISKEETNASQKARAELVIDGVKIGEFSATSLLALESHLNKIKDLYINIPTLDTAKKFSFDQQEGVYKTDPEIKFRSVKRPKVIVKYEATEKHPAQTELLHLDFQVGKYETVYSSGRLALSQRNQLTKRIEGMIESVKIARSKANNAEVSNIKVGQKLFDLIHKGII